MTEKELRAKVRQLLYQLGLTAHYGGDAPVTDWCKGWPDLTIIGRGRVIFRELKGEQTRCTRDQLRMGVLLQRVGHDWAVWRPADLASRRIQNELEALR